MTTRAPAVEFPVVLTLQEAAAYLRVNEKTLRDLAHRREGDPKRVPHFRIGVLRQLTSKIGLSSRLPDDQPNDQA